jgi:hypothetical protein
MFGFFLATRSHKIMAHKVLTFFWIIYARLAPALDEGAW